MKSLIALVKAGSIVLCLGLGAVANAASFSPPGAILTTSSGGTITIKSASTFGAAVNCSFAFTGVVEPEGAGLRINTVSLSGGAICALYQPTDLPWRLTRTSIATGQITGMALTYATTSPAWPATHCAPSTVSVSLANTPGGLSVGASNQALTGGCTIVSLGAVAPGITVLP